MNDKSIADRFPNSKIIQKAFDTGCNCTIDDYSSIWFKQKQRNWSHTTIRGYSQKYNSYIKPNWGHLLLTEFKALTGVAVLLNTSFNLRGHPIVDTPADAFATFCSGGIDIILLGSYLITKQQVPENSQDQFRFEKADD